MTKTSVPTDSINYDAAVREAKEILAQIAGAESGQRRLGELADQLKTYYNDRTLAKFAKEIGVAKCTLDRYRSVYRAWKGKLAPGANISYAVLRELATHPEREEIIREKSDLTKREAQDLMREQKESKNKNGKNKNSGNKEKEEDWIKHCRAWFKDLVALANDATRTADVLNQCTPEQLDHLLQVVDPNLLEVVRRGGTVLIEVADLLEGLLEEPEPVRPAETAKSDGLDAHASRL